MCVEAWCGMGPRVARGRGSPEGRAPSRADPHPSLPVPSLVSAGFQPLERLRK